MNAATADYALVGHPTGKHGPRKGNPPIDMLVLHYTGLPTLTDSLEALADGPKEVSSHYLIDIDGTIYHLVPEDRRAWHAGLSYWRGERDINSRSIGIELQHPDGNAGPYPEAQIASLIPLCQAILKRHPISPRNVVGHSDIAPDRKEDPGTYFPWKRLAEAGIGIWPEPSDGMDETIRVSKVLHAIGYDPDADEVMAAFQRRFMPEHLNSDDIALIGRLASAFLARANEFS